MNLEDQVAPLALAHRMKEVGFPQETCFAWAEYLDVPGARDYIEAAGFGIWPKDGWRNTADGDPDYSNKPELCLIENTDRSRRHWNKHVSFGAAGVLCAAPTLAEMGEWLHRRTMVRSAWCESPEDPERAFACVDGWTAGSVPIQYGATEAEARARLLIALAESGALDPKVLGMSRVKQN